MSGSDLYKVFCADTRRHRRSAIGVIRSQLSVIRDKEEAYMEHLPENFHDTDSYAAAEQTVAAIDEIMDMLDDVYP
jgi:hypothetical protein